MPTAKRTRPKIVNAKRRKAEKHYVEVAPGEHYRVRKVDLESLLFEGVIPSSMVNALVLLDEKRSSINADDFAGMVKFVSSKEFADMVDTMRRLAIAFVLEPKLTMSKQAAANDPDLLWVGGFSDIEGEPEIIEASDDVPVAVLMKLFQAVMGEANIVVLNDDDAMDFRTDESSSDDEAVSHGDGVPSETVGSDAPVDVAIPAVENAGETAEVGAGAPDSN